MNQKSLDKKKPKELDWEKEFKYYCNKEQTEILVHPLEIKSFIKDLLTQQRTELLEEILNLDCLKKEKWTKNIYSITQLDVRNQLRREIIDEINNLLKKHETIQNKK